MEGFIGIIIFYLIFWLITRAMKRAVGGKAQRPFPAARVAPQRAPETEPDIEPDLRIPDSGSLSAPDEMASSEGWSLMDEDGCIGGSIRHEDHQGLSVADDAGCLGGSLPHTHEDEPLKSGAAVHRHPARTPRPGQAAKNPPAASKTRLRPAEMRRALIYAEILGKPKGLQNRRRGA